MASSAEIPPLRNRVTFGKFQNVDMRVVEVLAAPLAEGTAKPSRHLRLDAGPLGTLESVAQLALVPEDELVGRKVAACCNLSPREIGPYVSQVLVLGALHPDNPEGQEQATPLYVDPRVPAGSVIF